MDTATYERYYALEPGIRHAAPTADEGARVMQTVQRISRFDARGGAILPTSDPHGTPWRELSVDELRERVQWCMLPEYHEALRLERLSRQYDWPIGPCRHAGDMQALMFGSRVGGEGP